MEEKKVFSKFELARLKKTAQNLYQCEQKKEKIESDLNKLLEEKESLRQLMEATDAPTKLLTGGYSTKDIIRTVIIPTERLNSKGELINRVAFEFIYPETIIPENKNEMSTFDETNKEPNMEGLM